MLNSYWTWTQWIYKGRGGRRCMKNWTKWNVWGAGVQGDRSGRLPLCLYCCHNYSRNEKTSDISQERPFTWNVITRGAKIFLKNANPFRGERRLFQNGTVQTVSTRWVGKVKNRRKKGTGFMNWTGFIKWMNDTHARRANFQWFPPDGKKPILNLYLKST